MNQKRYLIKGTLLLTVMGLLARLAGFFYKIFLSRTIGAAQIGLYQLAVPVYSAGIALCGGGVQSAISKLVAEQYAKNSPSGAKRVLSAGLLLSVSLSLLAWAAIYGCSSWIARIFLFESSCSNLLKLMAFSLPFQMVSSCSCGYFMGAKRLTPPALAQLVEQTARIFSVILVVSLCTKKGGQPGASVMALGQLTGEIVSAVYCIGSVFYYRQKKSSRRTIQQIILRRSRMRGEDRQVSLSSSPLSVLHRSKRKCNPWFTEKWHPVAAAIRAILTISVPLALNRILMCILQMAEAALLPQMLRSAGHSSVSSLSAYGTLTGMALPMILFPTAVTSALGLLLLPAISEAQVLGQKGQLRSTANAAFTGGLLLGSFCMGAFLLFGETLGSTVFHNELAGVYIRRLAFLCPLFYLSGSMMSILHGLGKSTLLLLWNLIGYSLRLLCIVLLVPVIGMNGYLYGLLLDQLLLTMCILTFLHHLDALDVPLADAITRSFLPAILGSGASIAFLTIFGQKIPALASLLLGGGIYCIIFLLCVLKQMQPVFHLPAKFHSARVPHSRS
ncbi:MAG: oligosaccharide flippase family protein [Lachnospiraceae bacterium]|nr:oligosaccharide flippase family protein [Lachnospiraceae bacterium]